MRRRLALVRQPGEAWSHRCCRRRCSRAPQADILYCRHRLIEAMVEDGSTVTAVPVRPERIEQTPTQRTIVVRVLEEPVRRSHSQPVPEIPWTMKTIHGGRDDRPTEPFNGPAESRPETGLGGAVRTVDG